VVVVGGGGGVSSLVLDQHVVGPGSQGVVDVCHELGRRDVTPSREGGMEDEGEAR